jgi:hypothetical protein
MGTSREDEILRVAHIDGEMFDPLEGAGGPIARTRSVSEFGECCALATGVPAGANATSLRNAMTLRGSSLIDAILDGEIVANQALEPPDVRGKLNRPASGRIGRFGWKAQTPTLVEFVGAALRDEIGVTNPLAPKDHVQGCGANASSPEADAVVLQMISGYLGSIDPPTPAAACLTSSGRDVQPHRLRRVPHALAAGRGTAAVSLLGPASPRHGRWSGGRVPRGCRQRERVAHDAALAGRGPQPLHP